MGDSSHVIGQSLIDAATVAYRTYLEEFFVSQDDSVANILADTISPNGGTSVTLVVEDWLGVWLEFLGARETSVSRAYSQNIPLRTWAQQMQIKRTQLTNDSLGIVAQRFKRFLSAQSSYKDQLVFDALVSASGAGPTGYDGVALGATTHPNGPSGNQSNLGTTALSQAVFQTAFAAQTSLQRENGEPFRVKPKYLIVGPDNRMIGMQITQADIRGQAVDNAGLESGTRIGTAGVTNVYNGAVELVVWPRLTGTYNDYFYLVGEGPGGAKPMVFVEWMTPKEQIDDQLSSPTVMATDRLTYGLIADGAAAAGAWQTIYVGKVA